MNRLSSISIILLIHQLILQVSSLGNGLVYIDSVDGDGVGVNNNGSYTVTINAPNGVVKVSIVALDSDSVSQPILGTVRVSCELAPQTAGYSSTSFTPIILSNAARQGDVNFVGNNAGRMTSLQCWGESVSPTGDPQFTKSHSTSLPVEFTILPAGTVNFCSAIITVPKEFALFQSTFTLEFSEEVRGNNVTVNCTVQTSNITDQLNITIPSYQANVGVSTVQMQYTIEEHGSPTSVKCTALSDNNGRQFLADNSAGDPAMFVSAEGAVNLYPQVTQAQTTILKAFLVLENPVVETEVNFICQLTMVNDTTEALDIALNPLCVTPKTDRVTASLPTGTTSSPIGNSTQIPYSWALKKTEIKFKPETRDLFHTIEIERSDVPEEWTRELVVVTCCAPSDSNNHPRYTNVSTALLLVAYMDPVLPVNWTNAPYVTGVSGESVVPNPAWVRVSPCPCDITVSLCDIGCCCDQDCTESEKSAFTCLDGIKGGATSDGPISQSCLAPRIDNWSSVMCIETANSAHLGYFYDTPSKVSSLQAYTLMAQMGKDSYTYQETGKRSTEENLPGTDRIGYKQGIMLKTRVLGEPGGSSTFTGYLTQPQETADGCLQTAPIHYLMDTESRCSYKVNADLCKEDSVLSAAMYIQSSTQSQPPCPRSPALLAQHGGSKLALTTTHYLCAEDYTAFVKSTENIEDMLKPNKASLFVLDLAPGCAIDSEGSTSCENGTEFVPIGDSFVNETQYARCTWDDSFTAPPLPIYNATTNMCHNAVVDVTYDIIWAGLEILQLNATIILADLPTVITNEINTTVRYTNEFNVTDPVSNETTVDRVESSYTKTTIVELPVVVTQPMKTRFLHNFSSNQTTESDIQNDVTARSGSPGYLLGKPLLSSVGMPFGSTVENVTSYNTDLAYQLALWNTDGSGLCVQAKKRGLKFGEDAQSGCLLRLNYSLLNDCDNLRRTVLNRQLAIMPSEYVRKFGDPDLDSSIDWLSIVREPFFINNTEDIAETNLALNITSGLNSTSAPESNSSISNKSTNDEVFQQLQGVCADVPATIYLQIFYAVTGELYGEDVHQITGAYIKFEPTTWSLGCSGVTSTMCSIDSDLVQSFTVNSVVKFIKVPAREPDPVT
ncbi:unnamed protein product, partial [Owenia fusiformis]